jgi:signal transduction histidine kinase
MQRNLEKAPPKLRAKLEESVLVARSEVSRLDNIITQFLRAIRPQSLNPEPTDINRIVDEVFEFLHVEIQDRDVLVEKQLEQGLPLLQIDRDQIKQAFYNICRNSFQAMNSGGILRVSTSSDASHVQVVFTDSGGGISPENITRIFEPYFTTKSGGNGLGLLIVRRIVRAHGGEVILESSPGRGLTVRILLPRADQRVRFLEQGTVESKNE